MMFPKFKGDDKDFNEIDFEEFDTDEVFNNSYKYKMWLHDKMKEQGIGVTIRDKVIKIMEDIGILKFPFDDTCAFPDISNLVSVQPMVGDENISLGDKHVCAKSKEMDNS